MKGWIKLMKISKEFVLREIAGSYIVVPFGENTVSFNAMITLNETGAFLWKLLQEDKSAEELIDELLKEYDVDFNRAKEDIADFLEKLKKSNIIKS